jgi:hypothetical protein
MMLRFAQSLWVLLYSNIKCDRQSYSDNVTQQQTVNTFKVVLEIAPNCTAK